MLDATSPISGLGFPPIDYVAMWAGAASAPAPVAAPAARSGRTSPDAGSSAVADFGASRGAVTLFQALQGIDPEIELNIARLKEAAARVERDRAAQSTAGGPYVRGGASFAYTIGPDGALYATGVSLNYDTTPIAGDPQATITKMQQVRSAALATTTPTAADLAAVSAAMRAELQARLELVQQAASRYLTADSAASAPGPGLIFAALA